MTHQILGVVYVDVVAGPAFIERTEDGERETHRIYVSAATAWAKGKVWTHEVSFAAHEVERARALAEAVEARGEINTAHWYEGSCWDGVRAEVEAANEYAAMGASEADLERMGLA